MILTNPPFGATAEHRITPDREPEVLEQFLAFLAATTRAGGDTDARVAGPYRGGRAGRSAHRMCHHHSHRERRNGDYHSAGAVHAAGLACCWMVFGSGGIRRTGLGVLSCGAGP